MSQKIDVPGVGVVDFPDEMQPGDIEGAIKTKILPGQRGGSGSTIGAANSLLKKQGLGPAAVPDQTRFNKRTLPEPTGVSDQTPSHLPDAVPAHKLVVDGSDPVGEAAVHTGALMTETVPNAFKGAGHMLKKIAVPDNPLGVTGDLINDFRGAQKKSGTAEAAASLAGVDSKSVAENARNRNYAGLVGDIAAPVLTLKALGGLQDAAIERGSPLLKKASDAIQYPMDKRMNTVPPSGAFNPVEAHTPAEIKTFAENPKNGPPVKMSAAEVTEAAPLRSLQGAGEKSMLGSGPIRARKEGAQHAVYQRAKTMMDEAHPGAATPEQLGGQIKQQTEASFARDKEAHDAEFDQWRKQNGDIDVDFSNVNKKYQGQANALRDVLANLPKEHASKLNALLDKASGIGGTTEAATEVPSSSGLVDQFGRPSTVAATEEVKTPHLSLSEAKELRSAYMDVARELKTQAGNVGTKASKLATEISTDIDGAMAKSIESAKGPEAVKSWRDMNGRYKKFVEDYNGDGQPLAEILQTKPGDELKIVKRLSEQAGTGGNPANVRALRERGVDLGPWRRHVIQDIVDGNYGVRRNQLGGYSDEFLQELFAEKPQLLDNLYKNAKIARSIKLDSNPSNTAGVMSNTSDVEAGMRAGMEAMTGHPLAAGATLAHVPGAKYLGAKLSEADWFRNWMTRTKPRPVRQGEVPNSPVPPPPSGSTPPEPKSPETPPSPEKPKSAGPHIGPDGEVVWPESYGKSGAGLLTRNEGGGGNYSAADLAAFKAKHGIGSEEPEAKPVGVTNMERLDTGGHHTAHVPRGAAALKKQADAVYAKFDADPDYQPTPEEEQILNDDAAAFAGDGEPKSKPPAKGSKILQMKGQKPNPKEEP